MLAHAWLMIGLLAAGVLMIFAAACGAQLRLETYAQRRRIWTHATAAQLVYATVVVLVGFGLPDRPGDRAAGQQGFPDDPLVAVAADYSPSDRMVAPAEKVRLQIPVLDAAPQSGVALPEPRHDVRRGSLAPSMDHAPPSRLRLVLAIATGSFLLIWPVGTLVLLTKLAWTHVQLYRGCSEARGADSARLQQLLSELADRVGVRDVPVLRFSRHPVPAAAGLLNPVILWPAPLAENSDAGLPDDAELAAVLSHELAHVVRRDPLWKSLAAVLTALLWWHPFAWWTQRQLMRAAELAADEAALAWGQDRRALARGLVNFAARALASAPVAVSGGHAASFLRFRVTRLLATTAPEFSERVTPGRRSVVWGSALVSWLTGTTVVLLSPIGGGGSVMAAGFSFWKTSLVAASLAAIPFGLYNSAPGTAGAQERDREVAVQRERSERDRPERDRPERDRPREEARREGERDVERVSPEQIERLRRQAEELEAAIREAREAGRADAVERYQRELRRVLGQLRELNRRREILELREHLGVLQGQLREALEAGQEERAEELRRRIEEVVHHLRALSVPSRPDTERAMEALRGRLEELRHRIEDARAAGREREVAELERAIARTERELHRMELLRELEVARRRLAEAREAGREEEARAIARRIGELEGALRELQPEREAEAERREAELREFAHRLERAVNILRLAGLEDMAELLLHSGRERLERMTHRAHHDEERAEEREHEEREREHERERD